ncbi:MAG: glycoside hydrolase family 1, partial [Opitutaceae bacterium]|nr:glycoside hydrolase family 1 [Opitutaceae bacterium]
MYLAGDINDWQHAVGNPDWQLRPVEQDGGTLFIWTGPAPQFLAPAGTPPQRFKFVTATHAWLDVPPDACNATRDDAGNINRHIDPARTGQHLHTFTLPAPLDLSTNATLYWHDDEQVPIRPGAYFTRLASDVRLGAIVLDSETLFRIFAPRATRVELCITDDLSRQNTPHRYPLAKRADNTWEIILTQNLHAWYYWYHIDGPKNKFTRFDPAQRILDPYALATVDRDGPGIIIDREKIPPPPRTRHRTPAWQDLVICEAHVRDLIAHAPLDLAPEERLTFAGLTKWVEHPRFHLHRLGVNAIELQPVQEFDNLSTGDYHWGYMTNNYFAPESSYATDPARATGIAEFQKLVAALHRRGIAVILDVVYNHVGEPAHLLHIDQLTYFHTNPDGSLSNWSGCGNDLNADSAMARRLILDSLTHLIETYDIDGFRFDLADLLGLDALKEIERTLKKIKPGIVLIAEPWSYKGHIAGQLRDTGWASWNDGYRNFIRDFVRGGGTHETYEYYLKGSPWHYAKWPAQTINYSESHDDRCWLDLITENPGHNGNIPTCKDRRRTRLMAAILFMSIGVPMISAGQDFLRSKQGLENTYLRGDINALDYTRILRFPSTHACFAGWIHFRLGETGRLLRQYTRPRDGFFRFYFAENSTAAATLYNADCEQGPRRLLFAINPTDHDATLPLPPDIVTLPWVQRADQDQFYGPHAAAHPDPPPPPPPSPPPPSRGRRGPPK